MAVKVNIEALRSFEKPVIAQNQAYIDVLLATKAAVEAIGSGTGIEEAIERNGVALEKAYNDDVLDAAKTVIATLTASAENAEEVQKVMASVETLQTSAIGNVEVVQGVRPAAFKRG